METINIADLRHVGRHWTLLNQDRVSVRTVGAHDHDDSLSIIGASDTGGPLILTPAKFGLYYGCGCFPYVKDTASDIVYRWEV